MDFADYLYMIAELSAVLTGFSALIIATGAGAREGFGQYVLQRLVIRGIFIAGLALLPILLSAFEISEKNIWSISSAIPAIFLFQLAVTSMKRRINKGAFISAWAYYPRYLIGVGTAISLAANIWLGEVSIFLLGITVMLGLTALLLSDFVSLEITRAP